MSVVKRFIPIQASLERILDTSSNGIPIQDGKVLYTIDGGFSFFDLSGIRYLKASVAAVEDANIGEDNFGIIRLRSAKGGISVVNSLSDGYKIYYTDSSGEVFHVAGGVSPDTKNTAGATNSTDKLFLVGSPTQDFTPQTYTNMNVFAENGELTANKLIAQQNIELGIWEFDSPNDNELNFKKKNNTGRAILQITNSDKTIAYTDNITSAINTLNTIIQTQLEGKQDTLISGTNIKTLSGQSLLGSGNLTLADIGAAGASSSVYLGTTAVPLNRASGPLTLNQVSVSHASSAEVASRFYNSAGSSSNPIYLDSTGTPTPVSSIRIEGYQEESSITFKTRSTDLSEVGLFTEGAEEALSTYHSNGNIFSYSGGDFRSEGFSTNKKFYITKPLVSLVDQGTAPFAVNSTTLVAKLNSDLLDGQHGAFYLDYNNLTNPPTIPPGTITGVTAGTGLSGGGTSGAVTLNLDFSELTDMTADITGATEFILQNGTVESRKSANEIKLSNFLNDLGWTTNTGTVTSIVTNNGITGGPISITGTIGLTGRALALHNLSATSGVIEASTGTNLTTREIDTTTGGISGSASLITSGAVFSGLATNYPEIIDLTGGL